MIPIFGAGTEESSNPLVSIVVTLLFLWLYVMSLKKKKRSALAQKPMMERALPPTLEEKITRKKFEARRSATLPQRSYSKQAVAPVKKAIRRFSAREGFIFSEILKRPYDEF